MSSRDVQVPGVEELQRLLHELHVHQAELEVQNEELRVTRDALEEARDRYLDLYDFAPIGLLSLDRGGVIREVSAVAATLLGLGARSLVGTPFSAHLDSIADVRAFLSLVRGLRVHEPPSSVTLSLSRQDRLHRVALQAQRTEGHAIRVALVDVTERWQAEQRLSETMARLQAIFDTVAEVILTVDARGAITSASPSAEALFGSPPSHLEGRNVRQVLEVPAPRKGCSFLTVPIPSETLAFVRGGGTVSVEISCARTQLDGADALVLVVRDLTQRKRLDEELIAVGERVQRRIGQDLHDGLSQLLAGVTFLARQLHQKLQAREAPEQEDAGRLVAHLQAVVVESKAIAQRLHPVELEANGLMWALKKLASDVEATYGVRCRLRWLDATLEPTPFVATNVYRICQEAVANAVRHGEPRSISITVDSHGGAARLQVRDDGRGLPSDYRERGGMGLTTMLHRARLLEGSLQVRPAARSGTLLQCNFRPLLQKEGFLGQS